MFFLPIGDAEAVKSLIEKHPDMISTLDGDGNKPIYWGVLSGNVDVVKLLLQSADVNAKIFEGMILR